MDRCYELGLRESQKIIISLQILRKIFKPFATVIALAETCPLDHCTHTAVKDDDGLSQYGLKPPDPLVACHAQPRTPKAWQTAKLRSARLSE